MNKIGLMLRLEPDVRDWVAAEAKKNDRSMNGMISTILKEKKAAVAANEKTLTSAGKQ